LSPFRLFCRERQSRSCREADHVLKTLNMLTSDLRVMSRC